MNDDKTSNEIKQLQARRQDLMLSFVQMDSKVEGGIADEIEQMEYEQARQEILRIDEELKRLSEKK